jgi:beta-glucanase (GH16 family)
MMMAVFRRGRDPDQITGRWGNHKLLKLAGALVVLCAGTAITASQILASPTPVLPGTPQGHLEFSYNPSGSSLNHAAWNTYVTSNAAEGRPWNGNGRGGSTAANYPNYDAEYDLPGQISQHGGTLILKATKTPTQGILNGDPTVFPFASGVLSTYGKFEFTGGYLQIRAKMPKAVGMWPALWMLPGPGGNAGDNYEIDLFEGGANGSGPRVSYKDMFAWHLHTPSGTVGADTNSGVNLTSGFNTYGLNWVPGVSITWYLNGKVIGEVTSAEASIPDEPMELIISLQVANDAASYWHTAYSPSGPANDEMLISSIKVFS